MNSTQSTSTQTSTPPPTIAEDEYDMSNRQVEIGLLIGINIGIITILVLIGILFVFLIRFESRKQWSKHKTGKASRVESRKPTAANFHPTMTGFVAEAPTPSRPGERDFARYQQPTEIPRILVPGEMGLGDFRIS